jgi:hypothetical protein
MNVITTKLWHAMITFWNGERWRVQIFNLLFDSDAADATKLAVKYFAHSFEEDHGYSYIDHFKKTGPGIPEMDALTVDISPMGTALRIEE